jgi:hypothetical protein
MRLLNLRVNWSIIEELKVEKLIKDQIEQSGN